MRSRVMPSTVMMPSAVMPSAVMPGGVMPTAVIPGTVMPSGHADTGQSATGQSPTHKTGGESPPAPRNRLRSLRRLREDAGAATAEYLVATMAAVGFAGLLIVILRGNEVRGILTELVRNALSVG